MLDDRTMNSILGVRNQEHMRIHICNLNRSNDVFSSAELKRNIPVQFVTCQKPSLLGCCTPLQSMSWKRTEPNKLPKFLLKAPFSLDKRKGQISYLLMKRSCTVVHM